MSETDVEDPEVFHHVDGHHPGPPHPPPTPPLRPQPLPLSLVGLFFYVFGEDRRVRQFGSVRGEIGEETYLIEFCDHRALTPSYIRIVYLQEMLSWQFCQTEEDMHEKIRQHDCECE